MERVRRELSLTILISAVGVLEGCARMAVPTALDVWPTRGGGFGARSPGAPAELTLQETVRTCLATAQEFEAHGHAREAIALYEKVRALDSNAAPDARRMGMLYDRAGDFGRSLAYFQTALEAEPKNADLLNDLADLQYRLGNLAGAEACLRRALELAPEHPRAWTNLGKTLARQGRVEEAFEAFCRVVGPAAAHANLGVILAQQGRLLEAEHALRLAAKLDPQLVPPRALLASYFQRIDSPIPAK